MVRSSLLGSPWFTPSPELAERGGARPYTAREPVHTSARSLWNSHDIKRDFVGASLIPPRHPVNTSSLFLSICKSTLRGDKPGSTAGQPFTKLLESGPLAPAPCASSRSPALGEDGTSQSAGLAAVPGRCRPCSLPPFRGQHIAPRAPRGFLAGSSPLVPSVFLPGVPSASR